MGLGALKNTIGTACRRVATGAHEIGQSAYEKASQAGESLKKFKGSAVATVADTKTTLTNAGSQVVDGLKENRLTRAIRDRFAGTESIREETDQLRQELGQVKTDEQLQPISERVKGLLSKVGSKLPNKALAQQVSKASEMIESAESGDLELHAGFSTGEFQQVVLQQLDPQVAGEELLRKTEKQLEEMQELESQIIDLHDMNEIVLDLLHEQSAAVNSLESNVETIGLKVEHGVKDIESSKGISKKNTKLKAALAIALAVLAAIALVLVIL